MPKASSLLLSFMAVLLIGSLGCAPSSQSGQSPSGAASQGAPELSQEIIERRINDARVYEVMPESGTGEPIPWSFDEDEPKEIAVVERQVEGNRATIILDIKTQSSPRSQNLRHLAGQIRTEWELKSGWALRRWEIVHTENISMKYKDMPKPPKDNPNRPPNIESPPSGAPR